MIKRLIFLAFMSFSTTCIAQYQFIDSFTTEKGLPSNFIYKCFEDSKGFLWITTDAGIAKFDGIKMKVFNTQHGIPDIDILDIIQDKDDRIWIKGNNNKIAYYDENKSKFIPLELKDFIGILEDHEKLFAASQNEILINSANGAYVWKDGQLVAYPYSKSIDSSRFFLSNKDESIFSYRLKKRERSGSSLTVYLSKSNKLLDSINLTTKANEVIFNPYNASLFLLQFGKQHMTKISAFTNENNNIKYKIEQHQLIHPYYDYNFTNKYLIFQHNKDKVVIELDVYDKMSSQFLFTIRGDFIAWHLYNDRKNNLWVSTQTGLRFYKDFLPVRAFLDRKYQHQGIYSLAKGDEGDILMGTNSAQVLQVKNEKLKVHKVAAKENEWQTSIIKTHHKTFSFSDGGIFVNYNKQILFNNESVTAKTSLILNDTTILVANENQLFSLNAITEKIQQVKIPRIAVSTLASFDGKKIYIGSHDGLHIYQQAKEKSDSLYFVNKISMASIKALCIAQDKLLWIGTINGLRLIRNDSIIDAITGDNGLLSNEITTIAPGKSNQIWIGTITGLTKINYSLINNKLSYTVQNISAKDGLGNNAIHQLLYLKDTVLAATDKGVYSIPDSIPIAEIPIVITRITINQKDTLLLTTFDLAPNQNNISFDFSGVNLNGYFSHAQYSQDHGLTWTDLEANNFKIEFKSGQHDIWLRAVDVNKNISKKITKLSFNIAKHIYEELWFWLTIAAIILSTSIYTNTIITKRKQQKKIDELMRQKVLDEMEIESLKSQMNPHFVFNCLNSIKGFIYKAELDKAELYLQKFSDLLRNTLNYSSRPSISLKDELAYIDTYLTLEKLRFGNKFDYKIETEEGIALNNIAIPAMLLQPFVENSIKHGVSNLKDGMGFISVNVYIANDLFYVIIDDNGIGRKKANEIKQLSDNTHESKGTQLTQRRLDLYHIELKIIDKVNAMKEGCGTTIELKIPL